MKNFDSVIMTGLRNSVLVFGNEVALSDYPRNINKIVEILREDNGEVAVEQCSDFSYIEELFFDHDIDEDGTDIITMPLAVIILPRMWSSTGLGNVREITTPHRVIKDLCDYWEIPTYSIGLI